MAAAAWNNLMARIGYSDQTQNYLHSAAGINNPSTLVAATALHNFNKFIEMLAGQARFFKLANNQTEAHKPNFVILSNCRFKAFWWYLEC